MLQCLNSYGNELMKEMTMRISITMLCLLVSSTLLWAYPGMTGYSGAPSRGTCASSCHGSPGGSIYIDGFPELYTPGQTYDVTIAHSDGNHIRNFNSSARIGTGTANAGTLAGGTNTVTYNTSGETNGIHLSSSNQHTGTFLWTAPEAGTGEVRLYVAGLQGSYDGVNSEFAVVAGEMEIPLATPENIVIQVAGGTVQISWDSVAGATSYMVYSSSDSYGAVFIEDLSGVFDGTTWSAPVIEADRFYQVTAQ
jgi:hypothetical protein